MNDFGHFIISLIKSILRIIGCILAVIYSIKLGFLLFGIAEILGIAEEIVDKRK